MARIGVVLHGEDKDAVTCVRNLIDEVEGNGHEFLAVEEDATGLPRVTVVDEADFGAQLDLVVSVGGDGTILRAVGLLHGADVKVLGVNFGDLGYLTVIEPEELHSAVDRALAGDHITEERMLVSGELRGETFHALNDIVIERSPGQTTVRISVTIDGEFFTYYPADGLIVATPTGSTAYALSARGPIVAPNHASMQLTPVSPHMLFDRTLVLEPETIVDLTVEGHRAAVVSVDGRTIADMAPGETIRCTRSPRVVRLVAFDRREHLVVLKSKLGLADR